MAITSCALTTAFSLDCKNSRGGIKKIYFAVYSDANAVGGANGPTNASGNITAWTSMAGSFFTYNVRSSVATGNDMHTVNKANGTNFSAQALSLQLEKLTYATSQELLKLEGNRIFAIVLDRNGKYFLMGGYNGLDVTQVDGQFGTAMGDFNGYKISLAGEEEYPMLEIASNIISGLIAM